MNPQTPDRKEEVKAMREAQKRLTWIDNVKRKLGYTQEQAEKKWSEINRNTQ